MTPNEQASLEQSPILPTRSGVQAAFNQRYFYFCVNAPYGNEIQFMHVDQMMHNEFVGMAIKKALAELFTDSMKKKAKEVTASVDL